MNTLISASAGSGKTHALTTEYLRLLHLGQAPEALLAATFTRKAAGEIFDRALSRLAAACLEENARATLAEALGDDALTQTQCRALLLSLCAGLDRLAVSTLDGFFGRLCLAFGQGAGLTDPHSPRCVALRRDALRAMLHRLPHEEAEALLDALHQNKAAHTVVGKFEDLVTELTESLADAPPGAWDRLDVPPLPSASEVEAALETLRATLSALTDKNWQKAVAGDLAQFESGRWEEFIGKGLAAKCLMGQRDYYKKPISETLTASYHALIGVARTELLSDLRRRTLAVRDVLTVFSAEYHALRRAEGLLLFSEVPGLLLPLMGDLGEVARRMNAPLDHLLLDEFQDTSDRQWGVLRHFARQAANNSGSVFVVGDVKQAIYGWRGGRAEIFERIESELPDMAREARDVSFRSSPVILKAVNQVFGSLAENPILHTHTEACARWGLHFHPHEAHHHRPGYVEMWETDANSDHGEDCAARIAACASRLPNRASLGVLVRRNETGTRMADALRARGIEVSSEGTGAIADDPAVDLILSALMLADHPGHTAAAFQVARSPLAAPLGLPPDLHTRPAEAAGISNTLRRQLLVHGYAGLLADWAGILAPHGEERTARRLEQLVDFAADMDALPPMRPSEFVCAARAHAAENPGTARVRVMTINRAKGLEFDAVFLPELDWGGFGQTPLCLVRRAELTEPHPVAAVYRYANETLRRLAPELEAAHAAQQEEELTGMLCLLYVALTRARHALHLFVAPPKPGQTPANLLRHALASNPQAHPEGEMLLYAAGDERWYEQS